MEKWHSGRMEKKFLSIYDEISDIIPGEVYS
jgi:hypothetical protein